MKKKTNITRIIVLLIALLYGANVLYHTVQKTDGVMIIGYHHVAADQDKEKYFKNSMWTASLSSFKEQMKLLHDLGYKSATLDDVYAWRMGKKKLDEKTVVITFDDGFLSSKELCEPILKEYGFTASVFVIGSKIDNHHGAYDASKRQHLSLADMKEQTTLSYFSHSYDLHHKDAQGFKINQLDKAALKKDCQQEKELVSTSYVAYPYGKSNPLMHEVLQEEGTLLGFGFNENRKARLDDDPYNLPRFCVNAYTRIDVFRTMLESK